jgi:hypothetical protein
MPTVAEFNRMFSLPREPETVLGPTQHFELAVPRGKRVIITDIYVENLGPNPSTLQIMEQSGAVGFEVRYTFRTPAKGTTALHFTTGLRLGDLAPIRGSIRIANASGGGVLILPRINGVLV